jgi:hypothetical protein
VSSSCGCIDKHGRGTVTSSVGLGRGVARSVVVPSESAGRKVLGSTILVSGSVDAILGRAISSRVLPGSDCRSCGSFSRGVWGNVPRICVIGSVSSSRLTPTSRRALMRLRMRRELPRARRAAVPERR